MAPPAPGHVKGLAALSHLAQASLGSATGDRRVARPHSGLLVLSQQDPSDLVAELYEPVVCLVVRGAKETNTTNRAHHIGAGQFLVVTHDMPVVSRIKTASPEEPYLALIASLDRDLLTSLRRHARGVSASEQSDPFALRVGEADAELVETFARYLRAVQHPDDAEVLVPLVVQELHYRLLRSPQGQTLRRLALGARPAEPVARVIELMRADLAEQLSVSSLARHVSLSTSALHHHFKSVTGTTPVQFQKQLRLLEARRLISSGTHSVTAAAYAVGYSSATQFSREYHRAFGNPPSADRSPRMWLTETAGTGKPGS